MSFSKDYLDNTFDYLRQLHKSAKSEVVLASNKNNNQLYVIKYIKNINLPYKEIKETIHLLLPQIEYVYEDAEQTIVVEEYINGRNLAEYLAEKGSLPEQDIIYLALAVCGVLKILHSKNIIHRDIKPANFLITNDGTIKLIDFDAARIVKDHKKQDTKYLGTEGYAPPEQYGFSQTDCRSDIYALGITIKDLVGKNYKGKLLKVIDKCTKVNPDQRFQSAEELERGLKNIQKLAYIKYALPFVCLIVLIWGGGWYFYIHKSQPSITENVSSIQSDVKQPDISDVKVAEQSEPKNIMADDELKKQTEAKQKDQEKPLSPKKEPTPVEKSSGQTSSSQTHVQNTTVSTPQVSPVPVEQNQQRQRPQVKQSWKEKEVSRGEIDAYFQLPNMNRFRFNNNSYEDVYLGNPRKIFPETKGEIAKEYPGSMNITKLGYLNIEITNQSDKELRNAWLEIFFDERYTAIPSSGQEPAKGKLIYKRKLRDYNLYNIIHWNIGYLSPRERVSFSLPFAGGVLLEEAPITILMSMVSDNSEVVYVNYYVYFKY